MKDKIFVIGGGTMGSGIAYAASEHGFQVMLITRHVKQAKARVERWLEKRLTKGAISNERAEGILQRIRTSRTVDPVKDSNATVIEAVAENTALKMEIFKALGNLCSKDTILASNTSSIPITKLATVTASPERVVGMHFMNPAPLTTLVEVVKGSKTSNETIKRTIQFVEKLDKIPIVLNDSPGFVVNRILIPMINEAICCLQAGVASKETIDKVIEVGAAHPMGPLRLADLIGLDICLNILDVLYNELHDSKYMPCPLLKQLVEEGSLGKKTGKGFYKY